MGGPKSVFRFPTRAGRVGRNGSMPAVTLSIADFPGEFAGLMPDGQVPQRSVKAGHTGRRKSLACAAGSCHKDRRDGGASIMPGSGRKKPAMRQKGSMPPAHHIENDRAAKPSRGPQRLSFRAWLVVRCGDGPVFAGPRHGLALPGKHLWLSPFAQPPRPGAIREGL